MNRAEFIKLAKADLRAQFQQVGWLAVLFAGFGSLDMWLAKRWEDQILRPD